MLGCARTLAEPAASATAAWAVCLQRDLSLPEPALLWLDDPRTVAPGLAVGRDDILIWMATVAEAPARSGHGILDLDQASTLLDGSETQALHRLVQEQDRRIYAAAHAGARLVLGRLLGRGPGSLRFVAGPHGKPELADPLGSGLNFNISHASGIVALAVAREAVGIDVEPWREVEDLEPLSATVLTAPERARLAAAPRSARSRLFLRFWTAKEAVLKALGSGFAIPPDELTVALETPLRLVRAPACFGDTAGWMIRDRA